MKTLLNFFAIALIALSIFSCKSDAEIAIDDLKTIMGRPSNYRTTSFLVDNPDRLYDGYAYYNAKSIRMIIAKSDQLTFTVNGIPKIGTQEEPFVPSFVIPFSDFTKSGSTFTSSTRTVNADIKATVTITNNSSYVIVKMVFASYQQGKLSKTLIEGQSN